jgi:ATP-dependent RNA helicase DeaD
MDTTVEQTPFNNPFTALGLDQRLVSTLTLLGYEAPTAIQHEAIPLLIAGRDMLGQAATGTGKTAAFALPLLHRLANTSAADPHPLRALILVPTRELAMQVAQAVHRYGSALNTRVLPIYGGQAIRNQIRALQRGVDVVIATPGRALDHIKRGTLDLKAVEMLVLDEADEMLDMGFADELEAVLATVPPERQTALFSATMAKHILAITKKHLHKPVHVNIANETITPGKRPRVRESAYIIQRKYKVAALTRFLSIESPTSTIVFCRTRTEVDELNATLGADGYQAEALHGGLSQEQRDRVLRRFRDGASKILVATDVAARGLDIDSVTHVANFDVPSSPDAYLHRIGRTGRAGREGVAITLLEVREQRLLHNIEQHTKRKITIEPIPNVSDVRAHRLTLLLAALQEILAEGNLESYRIALEQSAERFNPLDIAAAALKFLDTVRTGKTLDNEEIPTNAPACVPKERKNRKAKPQSVGKTRIFINIGRSVGIRPAELVEAITNNAKINARDIGSIDIADKFSLVEVPTATADKIIADIRKGKIRQKKVLVRRDREV